MFVAWGLTLPAAGLVAAGAEFLTDQGDWGVAAVAVFLVAVCAAIWVLSRRKPVDHTNVNDADAEPRGRRDHRHRGRHPAARPARAAAGPQGHHPGPSGPGRRRPPTPSEPPPRARCKDRNHA